MSVATTVEAAPQFWSEEPSQRAGRRRIRAHIGGLHCSLCMGTIEKALGRRLSVSRIGSGRALLVPSVLGQRFADLAMGGSVQGATATE